MRFAPRASTINSCARQSPASLFSVMLNARAGDFEPQATENLSQAAGSQSRAATLGFPAVMEVLDMTVVGAVRSPYTYP